MRVEFFHLKIVESKRYVDRLSGKIESSLPALNVINAGMQNYYIHEHISLFSVLYMQSYSVMCFEFLSIFHLM